MNLWNSLLKTATCEIYVCSGPTVGKAAAISRIIDSKFTPNHSSAYASELK